MHWQNDYQKMWEIFRLEIGRTEYTIRSGSKSSPGGDYLRGPSKSHWYEQELRRHVSKDKYIWWRRHFTYEKEK